MTLTELLTELNDGRPLVPVELEPAQRATATPLAIKYNVATMNRAGLEAMWRPDDLGRLKLWVRDPESESDHARTEWWLVDGLVWANMRNCGVREGFNQIVALGDLKVTRLSA